MGKQIANTIQFLFWLLFLIGFGLYLFRAPLLEHLLKDQLTRLGVKQPTFTIDTLTIDALTLSDISLGANHELRSEQATLDWTLPGLVAGVPPSAKITDLELLLDLTGERPLLGSLQGLLEKESNPSPNKQSPAVGLLPVSLSNATLRLRTPSGDVTVGLSGELSAEKSGESLLNARFQANAEPGQVSGQLNASLRPTGEVLGTIQLAQGSLHLADYSVDQLHGVGNFTLKENQLQTTMELALSGIRQQGNTAEQLKIKLLAEANIDPRQQLTTFKLSELNAALSGIDYAGSQVNQLALAGQFQGSLSEWEGEFDLSASADSVQYDLFDAQRAKVDLPWKIQSHPHRWQLSLRKPGQISFEQLALADSAQINQLVEFDLTQARVEVMRRDSGLAFTHQITLHPTGFSLFADRADEPALELAIHPGKVELFAENDVSQHYNGKITLGETAVTLPQYQMQLDEVTTTLSPIAVNQPVMAQFKVGQLRHLGEAPYFAPVGLTGQATLEKGHLSVDAEGGISEKNVFQIDSAHTFDSGVGNLTLTSDPLLFSPGGLQPVALLPGLTMLDEVSGQLGVTGQLNWSKQQFTSGAVLELPSLSFTLNGTQITGLSAALKLTDLLALQSPPGQAINIRHIELGVPLEDVAVSYQIKGLNSPQIAIDHANLALMGGKLSIGETTIDPASDRTRIVIDVSQLNLTTLFEIIEVEGLAGDGRLDGSIPLVFEGEGVSIQDGRLAATQPGILRLQSDKITELLAGRAEQVDLLLQALTEFHYTELVLILNNSADNDLVATLTLLGHNPNVLKGRLFRLNINLESNISKVLAAIAEVYKISYQTLRRVFR